MGRQASVQRRQLADVLAGHAGKKSIAELAKELGRSEAYIRCTAQAYGISMAMPKLTDEDRVLMRELRKSGMKLEIIADKFDCALSTAQTVCRGVKKGVAA